MTQSKDTAKGLKDKQIRFCEEYIVDWNASRAALAAGYSPRTAGVIGYENLKKPQIQAHIKTLKGKTEELAGVSKLLIAQELMKIVRGSASSLRKDWSEVRDWQKLSKDEKGLISEIEVTSKAIALKSDGTEIERHMIEEKIKYKVYDKLKAMEMLNRMFGFNNPEEVIIGSSIPAFKWAEEKPKG